MQPAITATNSRSEASPCGPVPSSTSISHSAVTPDVTITPMLKIRAGIRRRVTNCASTEPAAHTSAAWYGCSSAVPRNARTQESTPISIAPAGRSRCTG